MADNAPEIKVRLTAEDQGVAAAIKELGANLKTLKTQQDETAASASKLSGAFQGIIGAIAIDKLVSFGKQVFEANTQIARTSQVTGASAKTLSVLHDVADNLGVPVESVDKGLVKFSQSLGMMQEGSAQATAAFAALGLSAKDFAGLNTDQKLKLVIDRLAGLKDGTQKAFIAQQIFGRGVAELLPVIDKLGGGGFEKATEEARKFGLLIDDQTAPAFLQMREDLNQLQDAAEGATTQFEEGFVPALASVAQGLITTVGPSGETAFKQIGEEAGKALKQITVAFVGVGDAVGAVIESIVVEAQAAWSELKTGLSALFESAKEAGAGNFSQALMTLKLGFRDVLNTDEETAAKHKAIWSQTADDIQAKWVAIFAEPKAPKLPIAKPGGGKDSGLGLLTTPDAAAKAQLALEQKTQEDILAIDKAHADQRTEQDKGEYDQGLIDLADYYSNRRAALQSETQQELAILEKERADVQAASLRAAAAAKAATTPQERDKFTAEEIADKTKIEELDTRISEARINSETKLLSLNNEEFKERESNQAKVLDFQKQIAQLQGKGQEVAREEIAQEAEKLRIQMEQAGQSQEQIQAEIAQFTQLKTAQADFQDAQTKLEQDTKEFEIAKAQIELEAKTRKISQLESERELNDLIAARLPLLRADAQAELNAAKRTGNDDSVAAAQNAAAGVENLKQSTQSLGDTMRGSISQDFGSFFMNLGRNTASAANQFRSLAASVVASLEQILVKMLLLKIFGGGSGGGGGFLGGLFNFGGGHAEGGLIRGPGGPKDDAIPARLSAGEYVVKADAVNAFGVHNLDAINRGLRPPAIGHLSLPKFSEGGLVGGGSRDSQIHLGIGLDEGLVLKHMKSKAAGNIILQHLTNNPKAAQKALSRGQ